MLERDRVRRVSRVRSLSSSALLARRAYPPPLSERLSRLERSLPGSALLALHIQKAPVRSMDPGARQRLLMAASSRT